jgi:hypothetical protein
MATTTTKNTPAFVEFVLRPICCGAAGGGCGWRGTIAGLAMADLTMDALDGFFLATI